MDKCYITNVIKEMECYAREANIPIMLPEGIEFIGKFIRDKNIKRVLEIGTAIGYSALKMSLKGAEVVSIERDEERYKIAVENVKKCNCEDKIRLIFSDAFDTDISEKFDMILIDASKGKNKEFIDKFRRNLKSGGYIIIDNVDFHGLVGKSSEIKSRNLRALVRKIERFLEYLDSQDEFLVVKESVGDGLIILSEKVG